MICFSVRVVSVRHIKYQRKIMHSSKKTETGKLCRKSCITLYTLTKGQHNIQGCGGK